MLLHVTNCCAFDSSARWRCRDRKRWILSVPVKGELWLDSGAVSAVRDQKKSLFAAGILKITGDFAAQDAVVLCDSNGYELARGLCNYAQTEVHKVQVSLLLRPPNGKKMKKWQSIVTLHTYHTLCGVQYHDVVCHALCNTMYYAA